MILDDFGYCLNTLQRVIPWGLSQSFSHILVLSHKVFWPVLFLIVTLMDMQKKKKKRKEKKKRKRKKKKKKKIDLVVSHLIA